MLKEKIYIFFYLVFAFYESSRKLRIRNISLLEYVGTYQGFPEVTSTFISNREKHRNWTKYRTAEEKSFWLNTSLRRRPIIGTDYFRGARGYYGNEIEVTTIETVSVDFEDRSSLNQQIIFFAKPRGALFCRLKSPFTSLRSLFLSAFVTS